MIMTSILIFIHNHHTADISHNTNDNDDANRDKLTVLRALTNNPQRVSAWPTRGGPRSVYEMLAANPKP